MKPNRSIGTLFSLLALALFCAAPAQAQPQVGDAFPNTGLSLQGKAVLVDIWASWCGPCRASFPALEHIYRKYQSAGLRVVGISVDDDPAAMAKFLKNHPVSFPTSHDKGHKLAERLQIKSMPSSFLVDSQGKVRAVHNGFHGAETERALSAEIEQLLK